MRSFRQIIIKLQREPKSASMSWSDLTAKAAELFANQTKQIWINVGESWPPAGKAVLLFTINKEYKLGYCVLCRDIFWNEWFEWRLSDDSSTRVTHWAELLPPPENDLEK